ncbi:MAG TPA: SRPBCC family protein [Pseudomonadales bacterium]|nr:SRPBCC family protein [Pseudomonadales bacterium]
MSESAARPSGPLSEDRIVATYAEDLPFAARAVWPFFDWPNLERMRPAGLFAAVEYGDARPVPGAVRTIRLGGVGNGLPLVETLLECDADGMRLRYRIVDPAPMPIRDYSGEVGVEALGSARCRVRFASTCVLNGIDAAGWRTAYRDMQRSSLAFIAVALGG